MNICYKKNAARKIIVTVLFLVVIGCIIPAIALSPEMEADRLLMIAAKFTDQRKHDAAAAEFKKILDLKTKLPDEFYYQYGRHFYGTGELKKAAENVETYLKKAGKEGRYYRQSLQILTAIEERQIAMQRAIEYLARFVDHGNGTVTDTKTGLMWAAKDNGRDIKWRNARAYCQRYSGGGHTDWRLPTQDELASLYNRGVKNRHGYYVTKLIDISGHCPWASGERTNQYATFNFISGNPDWSFWTFTNRVLPVRSGKGRRAVPYSSSAHDRREKSSKPTYSLSAAKKFYNKGKFRESIDILENIRTKGKDNEDINSLLAKACINHAYYESRKGRIDAEEQMTLYKKAHAADPNQPQASYNLACLYAKKGQKEEAIKWLNISYPILTQPQHSNLLENIKRDPDLNILREYPGFDAKFPELTGGGYGDDQPSTDY